MSGEAFARALADVAWVRAVHHRESIGSTNDLLRDLVNRAPMDAALHGTVAVADHQTAGRGRHGRVWDAPAGSSLLMSVIVSNERTSVPWALLPALGAVAVAETLLALSPLTPAIKYPNDVLLSGRKVAGVLVETASAQMAIVGIGLNVLQQQNELPPATHLVPTSLALEWKEGSEPPGRPALLRGVLAELGRALESDDGCRRAMARFSALCATVGRRVRVALPGESAAVEGLVLAVDNDGGLVLRLDHGAQMVVHSGDVQQLDDA